ncbi:MAG: glycosyltransferase family 4 protein [Candidatus Chisholmbacteria bacterium]|nr:glycosyltransferase family 4 protein [Candidatus Chisholmbacteria bacterium]
MLIGIDANEANTSDRVGSNVYSFELLSAIEDLRGNNEYIIYLKEEKQTDLPQERKLFGYRVLKPSFLWTRWRLPLDLFTHHPRPQVFFTPGHYAPQFSPIPTVITILDLSFLTYPESFKPTALRQLTEWTKQSALNAAHILTISQASKKDIVKQYNIAPEKITVTYPGVSSHFRDPISAKAVAAVRAKYQLHGDYLLFIGTRQPKKNLPRLVEAFNSVTQSLSHSVTLVLAGKTWSQFTTEKTKPLPNGVKDIGFVPDQDLPALIKDSTAFVLPSLYEGFGIPVAEAMTVGTPVIVSNVSSLPEITGRAGILVDPHDVADIARGMTEALSLPAAKRVQFIKAGKLQAKKFAWRACATKTVEVLENVASRKSA